MFHPLAERKMSSQGVGGGSMYHDIYIEASARRGMRMHRLRDKARLIAYSKQSYYTVNVFLG